MTLDEDAMGDQTHSFQKNKRELYIAQLNVGMEDFGKSTNKKYESRYGNVDVVNDGHGPALDAVLERQTPVAVALGLALDAVVLECSGDEFRGHQQTTNSK